MKKIIAILLLLALLLCGCGWNKASADTSGTDGRMMLAYNDGFAQIYVDTKTGVQYFTRANAGTCVMVDLDGKPMPFPGFDAREDKP